MTKTPKRAASFRGGAGASITPGAGKGGVAMERPMVVVLFRKIYFTTGAADPSGKA
jgi:hypothetical protein